MKDYKPISCRSYDYIEHFSVKREVVDIVYIDDAGKEKFIQTRIADTKTRDKVEFLITEQLQEIRLDKLVRINNVEINAPDC